MKTEEWYANQILCNSGDLSDVDMFEKAVEFIEDIRREQHEATHKAMLEKVGQAISLVAREDSAFIPLFVALRDALNNVTFESTQEDK